MGEHEQGPCRALPLQPRHEVGASGGGLDELGLDAGLAQPPRGHLGGRGLVAGRVGGVHGDELGEQRAHLSSRRRRGPDGVRHGQQEEGEEQGAHGASV